MLVELLEMLLYSSLFVFCSRCHVLCACLCIVMFIGSKFSSSCRFWVLILSTSLELVIVLTALFCSLCSLVMAVMLIVLSGTVGYISVGSAVVL